MPALSGLTHLSLPQYGLHTGAALMRVQTMRNIDYFVGIPLCFLASLVQRVLTLRKTPCMTISASRSLGLRRCTIWYNMSCKNYRPQAQEEQAKMPWSETRHRSE